MIVLDTQSWLWYLQTPERLSQKAQAIIAKFEDKKALRVSAISIWEIALKAQAGKLILPMEIKAWYEESKKYSAVTVEPIIPTDLIDSTQLPGDFHKDPADRIVVSLARRYGCPLITSDQKIIDYPHVETVW